MKRFVRFFLVMLLVLVLSGNDVYAYSSEETFNFEYPDFSSEEWRDVMDHNIKVEACQIPDYILDSIPTNTLIEMVLQYPLLFDIFLYDNEQIGFEAVFQRFNGLQELFEREDAAQLLLEKYSTLDVIDSTEIADLTDEPKRIFDLAYIEIFLVQESILSRFSSDELDLVDNEIQEKYDEKYNNPDVYSLTAGTAYKVLGLQGANEYVTMQLDSSRGVVYTPNGSAVDVISYEEMGEDEYNAFLDYMEQVYSTVTILSEPTTKYNCHSYAWYSQSVSTNTWWMGDPTAYMEDGSYSQESEAVVGAKIYYSTPGNQHSGIVSELGRQGYNCYVTSKWGAGPLVYHFYTACPYWDSNYYISFWTR